MNSNDERLSLLPRLHQLQKTEKTRIPSKKDKIGFVFCTKDRTELSKRVLSALDTERGFDLIWLDESDTKTGREFPHEYRFKNARLVDFVGPGRTNRGAEKSHMIGIKKFLEMGYDYCGIIDNDILMKPGWFSSLKLLFREAAKDGIAIGAATIENYGTRVLEFRNNYTINWYTSSSMVLFPRSAAKLIEREFSKSRYLALNRWQLTYFYANMFGVDISSFPEWKSVLGWAIFYFGYDKVFSTFLYMNGLSTIGSIPNMAMNLGLGSGTSAQERVMVNSLVGKSQNNSGLNYPLMSSYSRAKLMMAKKSASLIPSLELMKLYRIYKRFRYGRTPFLDHMIRDLHHDKSI